MTNIESNLVRTASNKLSSFNSYMARYNANDLHSKEPCGGFKNCLNTIDLLPDRQVHRLVEHKPGEDRSIDP